MRPDELFPILRDTCQILEANNIPYVLTGGTLLGAVRAGDIIPHDKDFDLDVFYHDQSRIMALASEFAKAGVTIEEKRAKIKDKKTQNEIEVFGSNIYIRKDGKHAGDMYLFRIFEDGIARRVDKENVYYNAKMTVPAWFYEGHTAVEIRGVTFKGPRSPEIFLEKIYGDDWRTPLKPGHYKPGRRTDSGSVMDPDIETLIRHALINGWDTDYSNRDAWPREIKLISSKLGERWVRRHEVLLNKDIISAVDSAAIASVAQKPTPFRIARLVGQAATVGLTHGLNRAAVWRRRAKKAEEELESLRAKLKGMAPVA
jgi:hypothetical protein